MSQIDVSQLTGEAVYQIPPGPSYISQVTGEVLYAPAAAPDYVSQVIGEVVYSVAGPSRVSQVAGEVIEQCHSPALLVSQAAGELIWRYETSEPLVTPGGYDVYFTMPVMNDGNWVGIHANCCVQTTQADEGNTVGLLRMGNDLYAIVMAEPGHFLISRKYAGDGLITHRVRLFFHDAFASLYLDGRWIVTFAFATAVWGSPKAISLISSSGLTLTDIVSRELFAWRRAIYIEMEATGSSGIGSVIQERPIEITPLADGQVAFSYNAQRDTVDISPALLRRHDIQESDVSEAGSDVIVYYTDVAAIHDATYEASDGFATRVYRMSNLEGDALVAAQIALTRAIQSQKKHAIQSRPDLRLEVGDITHLQYVLSGSQTPALEEFIVEECSLEISPGQVQMSATGRNT